MSLTEGGLRHLRLTVLWRITSRDAKISLGCSGSQMRGDLAHKYVEHTQMQPFGVMVPPPG